MKKTGTKQSSKDVVITIRSSRSLEGETQKGPEFVTGGSYEFGSDAIRFSYLENVVSGVPGTKTVFLIKPSEVLLSRRGAVDANMVFRPGECNDFLLRTAFGVLRMGVDTRRLDCALNENGGSMEIEYDLEFDKTFMGRNTFQIDVRESGTGQ